MKRYLIIILLLFSFGSFAQNTIKISELPAYSANPSGGILPLVVGGSTKKFDAVNFVWTGGAYANPNWITSLAYSKLTGKPTTASGYGITDLYTQSQIQNFFSGTTGITGYNYLNWDAAYSWGNHSGLYRPISYVPAWSEITSKPSFATVATSGTYADLTGKPDLSVYALNTGLSSYLLNSNFTWANLSGKPSSFTPSTHTHLWADVTNRPTLLSNFTNDLGNYGGWITGINSTQVLDALGYTPENTANKGAANGYASLGPNAKILTSQLPDGSYLYKGKWNASTNSPTLANGTGTSGWTYRVEVGGTQNLGAGNITFVAGDDVIYNGTIWEKTGNTNLVTSVNGLIGDVTITIPTTLPASDVYAWAKAATKPSYAWSEITSKPTALSAFTNDLGNYGGFLTSFTETDPTISAWAKDTVKPVYTWTEITGKPTALSQFTNDLGNYGGFLTSFTETDPSVYAWAKASTKPTYTKTEIGLSNVVNILQWHDTNHPTTIAGYGITDIPTTLPASDVYAWAKAATKPTYAWSEITAKPTALSAFTNDLGNYGGWITGIDFSAVTTALVFTPVTNARTITINGTAYDLTANRSWTVGDIVSSGTYSNPAWITSLAYSKLTGVPAFLTSYTETDPTVYAWAKASTKPSYAWSEITAKPTALSAFTNDLGNYGSFLTSESDPSVYAWAKASTKPSYAWSEITAKPTALSAFTNDLGNYGSFLTTESDPLVYAWAKSPVKPAYTYAEIGGSIPIWNQNTTGNAATATSYGGQTANFSVAVTPVNLVAQQAGGTLGVVGLADTRTWLGLGSAAYTASGAYYSSGSTVANSTLWNNYGVNLSTYGTNAGDFLNYDNTEGIIKPFSTAQIQTKLGITGGPFLPLSGGTLTGQIGSSSASIIYGTGRASSYQDMIRAINTSADLLMTIEGSTAGARISGSSAYAGVLSTNTSTPLEFGTSNIVRGRFTASGVFELLGALTGTSASFTQLNITTSSNALGTINSTNATGGYFSWQTSGTTIADIGTATQIFGSGGAEVFGINARGSRDLAFGTNNTERFRILSSGAATFSSTVTVANRTRLGGGYIADIGGTGNSTGISFGAGMIIPTDGDGSYAVKNLGSATYPFGSGTFSSGVQLTGSASSFSSTYAGVTNTNLFTSSTGAVLSVDGSWPIMFKYGGVSGTNMLSLASTGATFTTSANSSWAVTVDNSGTTSAHGLYVNVGSSSTGIPFRVDKGGTALFNISNSGAGTFLNTLKQGTGSTFQFGNVSASGVLSGTGDANNIPIEIDGVTYYIQLYTATM